MGHFQKILSEKDANRMFFLFSLKKLKENEKNTCNLILDVV